MDNRSDKRNKRLQALCRNYLRRLRHMAEKHGIIMNETRNEALQRLCRGYLSRLRYVASKHGLLKQLNSLIAMNKRQECVGTEREVQILSRMVDDERISRSEIPQVLGKSYRECIDANDFEKIGKLRHVGTYSKVSALLLAAKQKKHKK